MSTLEEFANQQSIGALEESLMIGSHGIHLAFDFLEKLGIVTSKKSAQDNELNEHGFAITDIVSYSYGPDRRIIKGMINESMPPKAVYKIVNPENQHCQFDISIPGKTYHFFHNKVNGKTYRHVYVCEVKNYDF